MRDNVVVIIDEYEGGTGFVNTDHFKARQNQNVDSNAIISKETFWFHFVCQKNSTSQSDELKNNTRKGPKGLWM